MAPATEVSGTQGYAVLSPEQLYRIGQAAGQSGQDVEVAIDDVRKYLQDMVGSQSRENVLAAAERAVVDIEGEAATRAAAQDEPPPRTRSGQQTMEVMEEALAAKEAALQAALDRGHDVSVRRSLRQMTAAVAALEKALRDRARVEEWEPERLRESVAELRQRVAPTLDSARRVSAMEDAIAEWCFEVRTVARDGCAVAEPVLKEQSEDYTVSETATFLQEFGEFGRKMELLLAAPAAAGWVDRTCIEEANVELRAALDTMVGATEWIKRVHDGLPEAEASPEPRRRAESAGFVPPTRTASSAPSWSSFSSAGEGRQGRPGAASGGAGSGASSIMEQAAMSMFRMSLDGLEGRSRDWPKFSGKVLGYAVWKKEWQRHHHDKYKDLKGDSLKRIMLERCLPAEVKERVLFKRTIEEIWKYLDTAYNRPDVFLHDLMEPIRSARTMAAEDWRSLEHHMDLLRRTFEHADDAGMTAVVLHHNNLEVMYGKWPSAEQTKWWKKAATVDPLDQPLAFRR